MGSESLEKTILNKVDKLVEVIIELSAEDNEYSNYKENAINETKELIPLILDFVEGKIEYVEPMLLQLIKERLPSKEMASIFSDLDNELDEIIKTATSEFKGITDEQDEQHEAEVEEKIEEDSSEEAFIETVKKTSISASLNDLQAAISKVFPDKKVINNHLIRGKRVDVYLPQSKIALTTKKLNKSFEYFCQKQGIKVLSVPNDLSRDYRRLARAIKRLN